MTKLSTSLRERAFGMPKVYIVILNWNGWHDTIECVKSLRKLTYANYEIIIVDNDSTDESVEKLKAEFPQIHLIQAGKNLGFAGGNNLGIEYALKKQADYILLLNNDTVVCEDLIEKLLEPIECSGSVGITGPVNYYYDEPNKIWASGAVIQNWWLNKRVDVTSDKIDTGQYSGFRTVDYIPGSCMFVRREVFEKIGLLDERFFLDFEETDFCLRAKRAGYGTVVASKAKIWHKVGKAKAKLWHKAGKATNNGSDYKVDITTGYFHNRNTFLFLTKNSPKICLIISLPLHFFRVLARYFNARFLKKEKVYGFMLKCALTDFVFWRFGEGSINRIMRFNRLIQEASKSPKKPLIKSLLMRSRL